MKVTKVDEKSMTEPEETFEVRVDNEEVDSFMIYDRCFDVVKA